LVLEDHQKIFLALGRRSAFADALILRKLNLSQFVPPATIDKFVDLLAEVTVEGVFFVHESFGDHEYGQAILFKSLVDFGDRTCVQSTNAKALRAHDNVKFAAQFFGHSLFAKQKRVHVFVEAASFALLSFEFGSFLGGHMLEPAFSQNFAHLTVACANIKDF